MAGELLAPASGEHLLRAVSIDEAGNRSRIRRVRVVVDGEAPRVKLSVDPPPVLTGTALGGPWLAPASQASAVAEDEGSGVRSLLLEEAGGAASTAVPRTQIRLPRQGEVRLRARAVDGVGNASREVVFEARVDGEGPIGEILVEGPQAEAEGGTTVGPGSRLLLRFVDDGSGIDTAKHYLDGAEARPEDWNPAALSAGGHRLGAEAADRVGNRTLLPARDILVDKEAPEITWQVTSPGFDAEDGTTFYRPPVTVDLRAEDRVAGLDRLEWSAEGSRWSPVEPGTGSVVVEGTGISLRAVDRVGNRRQVAATWRVDLSPPRLRLRGPFGEAPPPGSTIRLPQGSSLEAWAEDDGSGVADQRVSLRRGHRRKAPHRYDLRTRGTYRLEVLAEDRLGNEVRAYWWVCVTRRGSEEAADAQ